MHQTFTGVDFVPLPTRGEFLYRSFYPRRLTEIADAED
jgi:hypothetical protein